MKCAKCGAELKVGCVYCSVCGQEAQIVSDDSVLEEELLRQLLLEEEASLDPVDQKKQGNQKKYGEPKKHGEQKQKKKSPVALIVILVLVAALLVLAATMYFVIRQRQDNSYEYQVEQAEQCVAERNYTGALEYYSRALELERDSVTTRMDMVRLYEQMEEPLKRVSLLHEVIELDPDNTEAYQMLIAYYLDQEDMDAILKLQEEASSQAVLQLFDTFQVEIPSFSLEPGTYDKDFSVELQAQEGCEVYYTLNGSDPISNGTLYREPILQKEQGKLSIRAVARSQYGLYSEILEGEFTLKYGKPKMPRATPDSGTFYVPTTIELFGVAGAKMYYTWDDTVPTANSTEYTQPILVPEGNNILSVVLIDEHGMVSDILKCNYKYLP